MDDNKKYTALPIPPRDARPEPAQPPPVHDTEADVSDGQFAEIEYSPAVETAIRRFVSYVVTPPEKLKKTTGPARETNDPVRGKFYEMRDLAAGNPFARNDAAIFYKQAKFMEDFSDCFTEHAPFPTYYPCYQSMSYRQLRTYFTWRAKVRGGENPSVELSYLFLYIYELLANIGTDGFDDGLEKLMTIWNVFDEHKDALNNYLPRWIRDYHIYYTLPHRFEDFIKWHGLQKYYPEISLSQADSENQLLLWNRSSKYDITKSKFYNDGNDILMRDCFNAVLRRIRELCAERGWRLEDLFNGSVYTQTRWFPFQGATFFHWYNQSDHQVEMPGGIIYRCLDNKWTVNRPVHSAVRNELVGYVIKKTESCLRQAVKYKHKITANPDSLRRYGRIKKFKIKRAELDAAVENAVAEFHKDLNRVVVAVDHGNLSRIREEALGTQDKLIVPEPEPPVPSPAAPAPPPELPEPTAPPVPASNGFAALKDALNATELNALSVILRGGDLKAFAGENGVMLEVLADSINEKAADCVGDSILDDEMTIYDDYIENIAEITG